jgi:renalase
MHLMASVAIIGAGMAGLAAGRELTQAGYNVSIFEQSRSVGGRVTTRRVDGFCIDHGAQLLKAPSIALLDLYQETGTAYDLVAPVWTFNQAGEVNPGDPAMNTEPKWVWQDGNNVLAKHMARGLALHLETSVAALGRSGAGYEVTDTAGERYGPFDAVLLTAPAPQATAILLASDLEQAARDELLAALQPVRYRPCISLALAYTYRPTPPWYALVNTDRRHEVTWLACEHAKPGRAPNGYGLILAQMAPAWSEANWDALAKATYGQDAPLPAPAVAVHTMVCTLLGEDPGPPLWVDAHRWRYALADSPCGSAASEGRAGIFVAGDMELGQGRAHLAISSGWAAARRIHAALSAL